MAPTKLGVLFVLLLYIVKIDLVLAQGITGACGGTCTGYGFCGSFYPTVLDTSSNTDPLDIILPMLLLAMYKKIGNEAETAQPSSTAQANNLNVPGCVTDAHACGGCNGSCACSQTCGTGCNSVCGASCGSGCGGGCGSGCGSGCSSGCGGGATGSCGGGCAGGFGGGCGGSSGSGYGSGCCGNCSGCSNGLMSGNCGGCGCC